MRNRVHLSEDMRRCTKDCLDAYRVCIETAMHCLTLGGRHADPDHVRQLLECANMCNTTAHFLILGSEHYARVCEVCAEICERCAESCEQLSDDVQMEECVEMCRQCADCCRQTAELRV